MDKKSPPIRGICSKFISVIIAWGGFFVMDLREYVTRW